MNHRAGWAGVHTRRLRCRPSNERARITGASGAACGAVPYHFGSSTKLNVTERPRPNRDCKSPPWRLPITTLRQFSAAWQRTSFHWVADPIARLHRPVSGLGDISHIPASFDRPAALSRLVHKCGDSYYQNDFPASVGSETTQCISVLSRLFGKISERLMPRVEINEAPLSSVDSR